MGNIEHVVRGSQAATIRRRRSGSKKLLPRLHYPAVGKCLGAKIAERLYSGYSERCPMCGAPPGHKCVGFLGVPLPVPHVSRELRAAASYRERVRREIAAACAGNGGSLHAA